jgi:hypothetical protein
MAASIDNGEKEKERITERGKGEEGDSDADRICTKSAGMIRAN